MNDPTAEDQKDPAFEAIFQVIKTWDLERAPGAGLSHGNGTDVMSILSALRAAGLVATPGKFVLPPDGVVMEDVDKDFVIQALTRCAGDPGVAATYLGYTRDQVTYRVEKFGLDAHVSKSSRSTRKRKITPITPTSPPEPPAPPPPPRPPGKPW